MRKMLATLGEADVPDDRLLDKFAEVVAQFRKATAAIVALQPENPVAQEHVARTSEAAAAQARRLAREAEAAVVKQMLQAAQAVAAEGELELAALNYEEAADLFGEAATLVPSGEPQTTGTLLWRQADAMQRHGEERGDNEALGQAIAIYGRALKHLSRDRVPLDWATVENDLGSALSALGERQSDTGRLVQAVATFRAALGERTRDRNPYEWAATQNNLGTALWRIGGRESGTARLGGSRRRVPRGTDGDGSGAGATGLVEQLPSDE
ncbi:MAG TPA: hypothetical protein VHS58_23550 [Acetobacteraceae bacterium]|nr:hypothetical protein [Acetobacteraceae bacterium]